MPARREIIEGHSFAKREPLAAPVDALDRTLGDFTTFADLEDLADATETATAETLASTTATAETLAE